MGDEVRKEEQERMFPLGLPKLEPIPGTRYYRLIEPFGYVTRRGRGIEIPAGFVTNGASIPRFFWRLVGDPFAPDYVCAAVVHDWLWGNAHSWGERRAANGVFAEILRLQGTAGWMTRCELETGVFLGNVWETVWPW